MCQFHRKFVHNKRDDINPSARAVSYSTAPIAHVSTSRKKEQNQMNPFLNNLYFQYPAHI